MVDGTSNGANPKKKTKKKTDTTPPPAPEGNDLSKIGTNVSIELGKPTTAKVDELVGALIEKVDNMEPGEERENEIGKATKLLRLFVLEELVSAALFKANDLEKEDTLEVIRPLVTWYNEHKPKKTKKECITTLKETPEALAA